MSEEIKNENDPLEEEIEEVAEDSGEAGSEESGTEKGDSDMGKLQQELAESKDQLLRLAAEFENFKKRMEREKETLLQFAGENIFRELLASVDNLDRALEQGSTDSGDPQQKLDALLEGVDLTHKGLLATLEKFEVFPIDSEGMEFDPNEHEAMTMESSDKVPANHVLQEFVKGYRFKDRLLRPAKVVVSQGNG